MQAGIESASVFHMTEAVFEFACPNSTVLSMLQNDRENLELDKLQVEIQRFVAETRKLSAEEGKLRRETFWYPLAVGAGMVTALAAAAGFCLKI